MYIFFNYLKYLSTTYPHFYKTYPHFIHRLKKITPQFFNSLCYKTPSIKLLTEFKCTVAESPFLGIGIGRGLHPFLFL